MLQPGWSEPRRHCRVCHRAVSDAHLADARHPSQMMAIHPNCDIYGHWLRFRATLLQNPKGQPRATFSGEQPVTGEDASSAMESGGRTDVRALRQNTP